ncbi:acyltransferase family protein [Demequina lignilytica]|uniref:Acyltransferase n=1 Tax=Demequina lignilytica TaxID=3051663 RepID=A0AB35MKI7_9MICO|nr:acyltransferase [Demequina sp. SYSU T0a273]MDN4484317.1 acyltransferase [Demequina sp. SYSU T0a273]
MAGQTRTRLAAPDYLKTALLFLVIFGHTYDDGVSQDLVKYMLYGFHMPVFLFLSGYLLSVNRLAAQQLPQVARHYWSRMLWQWLAVSVAFELFSGGFRGDSTVESMWLMIVDPRYHLWYVPVLFVAIVAIWAFAPYRRANMALGALTLVGYMLYSTPLRNAWDLPQEIDPRYLGYMIFVWLGVAVRMGMLRAPRRGWTTLLAIVPGAALYAWGFDHGSWFKAVGFLVLNIGLCLAVPAILRAIERPVPLLGPAAALISTYSLWIYLLHPFVTQTFIVPSGSTLREVALGAGLAALIMLGAVGTAFAWDQVAVRSRLTTPEGRSR